jgi:hypothetical protein
LDGKIGSENTHDEMRRMAVGSSIGATGKDTVVSRPGDEIVPYPAV